MATKQIAWQTGSGNITLTYQGQSDGSVAVESDENGGAARSQVITIETTKGSPVVTRNLTVSQAACPFLIGDIRDFGYTGGKQEILLPKGQYKLQCWGAQGGSVSGSYTATGSKGGYSEGILTLTKATKVYVFVGGQGSSAATSTTGGMQNGGFNGGGGAPRICQYNSGDHNGISYPRPGGGATDISLADSDVAYSNYRTDRSEASLLARQIVAGGGAGASARYTNATTTNTVSGTVKSSYYIGTVTTVDLQEVSTSSIQSGYYWNRWGETPQSGSWNIYKYAVTAGTDYWFSLEYPSGTGVRVVGWFDSNGNIVGYESYDSSEQQSYTDVKVTAPSGATYLYLNVHYTKTSSAKVKKLVALTDPIIGEKSSGTFKYYTYSVTAGRTYNISATLYDKDISISVGTGIASKTLYDGSTVQAVSNGRYYPVSSTSGGTVTIPSGLTKMYIFVRATESAPIVTYTTSSSSSGTSNGTQVGGGTSGGGTNPGTQSGGGGELGKGANMTVTNYRYASGGGGGGYYGGGASYDNSTTNNINQSGGGSGYVGSLENAQTKAGNTSFPSTSGGTETGHSGNGYARITRLS